MVFGAKLVSGTSNTEPTTPSLKCPAVRPVKIWFGALSCGPSTGQLLGKEILALAEAKKIKRLMGKLRYLYRASEEARSPLVKDMKKYVKKRSP